MQDVKLPGCAQVLAKAADALSAGDLVNRKVRQYGSWGLMPFAAAIGSVYPATYMRGARETFSAYENNFPRCWPTTSSTDHSTLCMVVCPQP